MGLSNSRRESSIPAPAGWTHSIYERLVLPLRAGENKTSAALRSSTSTELLRCAFRTRGLCRQFHLPPWKKCCLGGAGRRTNHQVAPEGKQAQTPSPGEATIGCDSAPARSVHADTKAVTKARHRPHSSTCSSSCTAAQPRQTSVPILPVPRSCSQPCARTRRAWPGGDLPC